MSDDLSIPNPGYRGNRASRYNGTSARRRPGMDPDTRRLMLFAGGVGGVLALLIAASAMTNRHPGQIPVVSASSDPIRVKPENPGGLRVDAAENDVFSGGADIGTARLGPAAETPNTRALQSGESSPPAAAAAPGISVPMAAPAKPVAPSGAKPAAAAPPAAVHPTMVQLAALGTEAAARQEWQRLTRRYADLFEGRTLTLLKTEKDGHTLWRVRTGGFAEPAQARAFCDKLRGKSSGCSIVDS